MRFTCFYLYQIVSFNRLRCKCKCFTLDYDFQSLKKYFIQGKYIRLETKKECQSFILKHLMTFDKGQFWNLLWYILYKKINLQLANFSIGKWYFSRLTRYFFRGKCHHNKNLFSLSMIITAVLYINVDMKIIKSVICKSYNV